jgi:hypothetical protein
MAHRIIHTDLYTKKAQYALKFLANTWHFNKLRKYRGAVEHVSLDPQPDGEIAWDVPTDTYDYRFSAAKLYKANDQKFRETLAWKLKEATIKAAQYYNDPAVSYDAKWKAYDDTPVQLFSSDEAAERRGMPDFNKVMTLKDMHLIFDLLLNKKRRKYTAAYKKIAGKQADPLAVELEVARREEVARLEKELVDLTNKLSHERYVEAEKAKTAVYAKYDQLVKDAQAEHKRKIKELSESMSFMTSQMA